MNKCKCGCGNRVTKKGNIYIHGHNHKGKTYEEIYGDLALEKKENRRIVMTGKIRTDMIGDKNIAKRPEIRKRIKEGVKESWNTPKGEERKKEMINYLSGYMASFITKESIIKGRIKMKKTNEERGNWVKDEDLSLFELYKRKVKKITEISIKEKYTTEDLKNRGRYKKMNHIHIDHIFSVQKGFINNILPEIIGSKSNIRRISVSKNYIKHTKCDININELFKKYDIEVSV